MAKFTTAIVGALVLCSGLTSGMLDLEEGKSCVDGISGNSGVCTRFIDCPDAVNKWNQDNQRPTVCSSQGAMAVVCCERTTPQTTRLPARGPLLSRSQQTTTNTRQRISQLKCKEYSKPVTANVSYIPLTLDPEPVILTVANCTYDKVELVVGGDPALPGQFPHMAAIGWLSIRGHIDFKCGGTLISDRFVLTAGHCTSKASRDSKGTTVAPTIIRFGDHDLRPNQYDGAQRVDMRIGRIIKHPAYKPPVSYNDIALLETDQPVVFNSFVRPACLWQRNDFGGLDSGIVTGWGSIAYWGSRSDVLLKVSLNLFSNDFCQPLFRVLRNRKWKEGFSNEQMCAGDLKGKHDSCQGDSGGPLQVYLEDNHCIFYVMGITSFGYSCGAVNGPGIYTRVSSFIPWIESVVWPNDA